MRTNVVLLILILMLVVFIYKWHKRRKNYEVRYYYINHPSEYVFHMNSSMKGGRVFTTEEYLKEFDSFKPKRLSRPLTVTLEFPCSTEKIPDARNGYDLDHALIFYDDGTKRFHNLPIDSVDGTKMHVHTYIVCLIELSKAARDNAIRMKYPDTYIAVCSKTNKVLNCNENMRSIANYISNNDNYFTCLVDRHKLTDAYTVQHILPDNISPREKETRDEIQNSLNKIPKNETVYYFDANQRRMVVMKNDGTIDTKLIYNALLAVRNIINYYPSTVGVMIGLTFGLPKDEKM